ncbi:MAG: hypothetical protein NT056_11315 [Proteobacteria bacterium]|nr:hypothetical protein [Pseudomonadota bacterium]
MHKVPVREIENLNRLRDYVQGRNVTLDQVRFDQHKKSIDIPVTVIEKGGYVARDFLLVKKWEHRVVSACLYIYNAQTCGIADDEKKGAGTINSISYKNDIITISFVEEITIKVTVSNLFMELSITENQAGREAYYARKCRWPAVPG